MERTQTTGGGITEVINMDDDKDLMAWLISLMSPKLN
jgi:hypothetical protein